MGKKQVRNRHKLVRVIRPGSVYNNDATIFGYTQANMGIELSISCIIACLTFEMLTLVMDWIFQTSCDIEQVVSAMTEFPCELLTLFNLVKFDKVAKLGEGEGDLMSTAKRSHWQPIVIVNLLIHRESA
ncbi:hypothetical protein J1614_001567 [Plenodomus biglobosus]|nr:hypothetical protein J1614_001567 [Plenodomus biglobosus]